MKNFLESLKPKYGSYKKPKKRLGRGNASGKGNACGRGPEGQKSRSGKDLGLHFQGGQNPLVKRIPLYRGERNRVLKKKNLVKTINISNLNDIDEEEIDLREILLTLPHQKTKLLGFGDLKKKVLVRTHLASKSAIKKIEEAGGKLEFIK